MKLKDLKIGTQLGLGLGLILGLVVFLAIMAWVQTEELWLQTKGLYDHPLLVRRAVGELETDILSMHRDMMNLILAKNEQERQSVIPGIDTSEADAFQQFDLLYDRYLGDRKDIDDARNDFVQWKSIREETIRLLRAGKVTEAAARTKSNGVTGAQVETLMGHVQKISDFARNRGDQFYRDAEALNSSLNRQLAVIVAFILLLSLTIAWLLLKGIKTPLAELTVVTEQFRQNKLDVRSRYLSANEFGTLSTAFNTMADAIQTQMQINENAAQLAGVMLREEEVHTFCRELLKALLQHTGSQVGAVYFLNEAKTAFEHFDSIGLGAGGRAAFSASELEGELGAALATRQIQRITGIPADTRFAFAAVSGEFTPREILTIPILSGSEVTAVISLASVRAYDVPSVRLINDIWRVLTARVNGVLAFRKIKDFAERLEYQNRELDVQADELTEQNTELEMQKRQLDEANRLKSAFLSNMSHELRTPLNSVIALSGVLNRRLANTIPVEEYGYLEVIERNGRNLLALINDILDLSRIEAGREEISLSLFSLRELTGEIVEILEPQAQEKGIALLNQVGEDLPPITSDLAKCRHILQNLVGNAVKFTEAGTVEISARPAGDEIYVTVRDTGIGVAVDQLPYIFEEFRQADDSASRKYGGTGLGLAIAKKYALLLRGGITVESTPGQGSTFTLRLPLALEMPGDGETAEAESHSGAAAGQPPSSAGQGQYILLVEDSEPEVIQMTDILTRNGYRVQVARNGHEALAQIEKSLPDAVILDLMMPEVDGFEVLKTIRSVERTAHLPVLVLTAKYVTREELSFLKGNRIHQLIQKGDIGRSGLLAAVARMVASLPEKPAPPLRRSRRPARPGKPVVLVVEDNLDNLRAAKALLQESYQVMEAEDGQAGVEQARRHQPDLILMDIVMPVMDGVQALQEIRKDDTLQDIPVIAVTSSAMTGNREEILAYGFDGYLSKPIDEELLRKTLHQVLYGNE
ncbi:MAG: response regulator [Candidatus Atribacteria bacterium]|nr:response regulator [Candidatus Atribacteria bacterium]